jgi:hypothetical protein
MEGVVAVLQAFALAELLDSQSQVRAMVSIIGALRVCIGCEGESYENLITRWVATWQWSSSSDVRAHV